MLVQDILSKKGSKIYHIRPDRTVYDAISIMSENNIGALLVMKQTSLTGIISEKDYRTKVILKGRTSRETLVSEIMTRKVITVTRNQTIESCMQIMTEKKIRHLPVMNDDLVEGLVSIGDMVKWIIDQQKAEIHDLKRYIIGSYPL